MMATSKIFKHFLLLLCVFGFINKVSTQECTSPLGMEAGTIKDSKITTSGVATGSTARGWQARLNLNMPKYGAWCVYVSGGSKSEKNYDQYIQIDLLKMTTITGIATQGREYNKGTEYVKDYKISYSKDGQNWIFYKGKYLMSTNKTKIFQGNTDVSSVVRHALDLRIIARYIRIHPGYEQGNQACMRLELYGCLFKEVIVSYSMPVGQKTKNGKVDYKDTTYTGVITNDFHKNGTGILTDGKFGPVAAKSLKGKGWVGWNRTKREYIDIIFEFSDVRRFKDVTLTVNVDKNRSHAVFDKSQIFFASNKDGLSGTSFLRYCPKGYEAQDYQYNANLTLPLCENAARFIKLRLYFGGTWLLITEISFNSVPFIGKVDSSLKTCSEHGCIVAQSPTTTSQLPVGPSKCEDCAPSSTPPTKTPAATSSSSNLPMIIIIICVILLIVILLVVTFLLYRKRLLCFGKMKQKQKPEKNIHVELQNIDDTQESKYDKIDDNVGNPLYASVGGNNDDTQPMLSPVKKKPDEFIPPDDVRPSELYSEPDVVSMTKPAVRDDYAEPVDSLQPGDDPDDLVANPIYEGIYSEPLYGIAGTILVGPQEETLKRGYTMEKFPRNRLVFKEKIGDGQFGEVHIAEADIRDLNAHFGENYEGKTKITVAVKTLKGDVKKDAKSDFFKEVRVMSRLQHENVVRLLGVCRDDPICMIVEYMENGDLNQFLKGHVFEDDTDVMIYANTKQPISYSELMFIASQVAAGMKYFAAMNFVHRDLAARNCLVGEGLTVKLADFGMSRLLYSKHYYRVQGRVMLPIRWMAPESIFQGRFTTQTDVWSFGITLWEIFTLAQDFPYPNLADERVISNAKTAFTGGTEVVYNDKPDICSQDVFDMMLSCWHSDPSQRPDFNTLYDFLMGKVGSDGSAVV